MSQARLRQPVIRSLPKRVGIEHDADLRTLHSRDYSKMGSVPVLLQMVTATPTPDILVRSPRLEA